MKSIEEDITKILEDYIEDVEKIATRDIKRVASETARELKNSSPKKSGRYASGWSVKTEKGAMDSAHVIVYNRTKPGLTHLLEHGHLVRNKFGTYGRARAIPHISIAEQNAISKLLNMIETDL